MALRPIPNRALVDTIVVQTKSGKTQDGPTYTEVTYDKCRVVVTNEHTLSGQGNIDQSISGKVYRNGDWAINEGSIFEYKGENFIIVAVEPKQDIYVDNIVYTIAHVKNI